MRRRRQTAAFLFALVAGCFTPTVPVPPPDSQSVTFRLTNQVCDPMDTLCDPTATVTTYKADPNENWPNSWVVVRCERTGKGAVTRSQADGSVAETEPFLCADGDRVLIAYEDDGGDTAGLCLILHEGRSNDNFRCP